MGPKPKGKEPVAELLAEAFPAPLKTLNNGASRVLDECFERRLHKRNPRLPRAAFACPVPVPWRAARQHGRHATPGDQEPQDAAERLAGKNEAPRRGHDARDPEEQRRK